MRWDPYVLVAGGEFDAFWKEHLGSAERDVLFVLGRGFDPRASKALERLSAFGALPRVWLLAFDNGQEDSTQRRALTAENHRKLVEVVGVANVVELPVRIGRGPANATSRSTTTVIHGRVGSEMPDDVVVDISAMPRVVALTAIAKLIYALDEQRRKGGKQTNLHVVAAESVRTDLEARGSLMDEVSYLVGFSGRLNEETTVDVPRVWFPVLGEGQRHRLERIRDSVNPDEICPVVPFPSRDPRRGDKIIDEHGEQLFEDFRVEPSNILRASEFNPFEAYRQLFLAMDRYRGSLRELGGCKAFVSPLSSKLLSVGALLACYDHRYGEVEGDRLTVGIPYVETATYMDPDVGGDVESELYSMWIRGEWEE